MCVKYIKSYQHNHVGANTAAKLEQLAQMRAAKLEQLVQMWAAKLEQLAQKWAAKLEQLAQMRLAKLEQLANGGSQAGTAGANAGSQPGTAGARLRCMYIIRTLNPKHRRRIDVPSGRGGWWGTLVQGPQQGFRSN